MLISINYVQVLDTADEDELTTLFKDVAHLWT